MEFSKENLPMLNGAGKLRVELQAGRPDQPLPRTDRPLLALGLDVPPGQTLAIGQSDTVSLSCGAHTAMSITPFWAGSRQTDALAPLGLDGYFKDAARGDRLLLLLDVGGQAEAAGAASAKFGMLAAGVSVGAGADARYLYARSFPDDTPVEVLIREFFTSLRLPGAIRQPLEEGEAIVFEYSGYATLGASLGYGYEISGAPSFQIGQLRLAERYAFSLMAKANLDARVAGRFTVAVRAGAESGWARVELRRAGSRTLTLAADVNATATLAPVDFPGTADELLEALLGLRARNFLALLHDVQGYTDFAQLQARLDTLSEAFVERFVGHAFDELADGTRFDELLRKARKVTDAYARIGDHAVALFDRYYNAATGEVDAALDEAVARVRAATDWKALQGDVPPAVWAVVNQLTDGDPLGWAMGMVSPGGLDSLEALKNRAADVADLIHGRAQRAIRDVVALAKSEFALDGLVKTLAGIDGPSLRALGERRLLGVVERLTGKAVSGLAASEVGQLARRVNDVFGRLDAAKKVLHSRIVETLTESAEFDLHAGYGRATDGESLVAVEINLRDPGGVDLMRSAAHGDFATVLASSGTERVRILDGVLTRSLHRQSKLSVHVVGWHSEWVYEAVDRLLLESEQRIVSEGGNQLTVMTTIEMQRSNETSRGLARARERVYTNLLLRFLGESSGALEFDAKNQAYLIDAIRGMSSRYQLVFDDESTTPAELAQYLSFADDFGLAASDAAAEAALTPLLPRDERGGFGRVSVSYDVRFTQEGLEALLRRPAVAADAARMRRRLRLMVLANYIHRSPRLAERAWAYWTPGVHEIWHREGANFVNHFRRQFSPIAPSPLRNLAAPPHATLDRIDLHQLDTLYRIEESLVSAFARLGELLQAQRRTSPAAYERALADFTAALDSFDTMDEGENTVFGVLDRLIQDALPPGVSGHRNSSLTVHSIVDGKETTRVLVA